MKKSLSVHVIALLTLGTLTGCDARLPTLSVPAEIKPAVDTYHLSGVAGSDLKKPEIYRSLIQLSAEVCNRDAMGVLSGNLDALGYHADVSRTLLQFVDHCGKADGFLSAAADNLLATGNFAEAVSVLDRLVAANPLDPQYYFDRGRANEDAERYDAALSDYMQVINLEADHAIITSNLFIRAADIHARKGRYCDAIGMIRMWMSASPDRADNAQAKSMIERYASKQSCPSSYASGHATFPRRTGDTIQVRARINGTEGTFIVDTGASYVSLTSTFAQRAHVAFDHAQTIHVQTANGARDVRLTQADNVSLTGVAASNVPVTVDDKGARSFGAGIDGLLGQSFLSRFETRFAAHEWSIAQR
ncbi:retroviral-like aspartic protease family protein [Burkholderia sp. Ac-20365]|uniref:retroviral-like aspartic protease family protein n=1 Tax=Burkholderia sp. Ac-20365 TaxID=2703897 RepID=UPI00197B8F1E|nr:retroviral-like aspartic protease family protein [Burkholderia sp. Ac-20365]MBN3764210.1 tetratricopeptide repeat protein [Burkholderia sp. Ac-20365]